MHLLRTTAQTVCILLGLLFTYKCCNGFYHVTSSLDKVKHIFPGNYDNKLQYELDISRNITADRRHFLLKVNVSMLNDSYSDKEARFLFQAADPDFPEMSVNRLFTIREFDISKLLLVTVSPLVSTKASNSCKMFWKTLEDGGIGNVRIVPCIVYGQDDSYEVMTNFELTMGMFSVDEQWMTLPDQYPLPGPLTPYHFMKQL